MVCAWCDTSKFSKQIKHVGETDAYCAQPTIQEEMTHSNINVLTRPRVGTCLDRVIAIYISPLNHRLLGLV